MNKGNQLNQNIMKNGVNDRMPIDGNGPMNMGNDLNFQQNNYYDNNQTDSPPRTKGQQNNVQNHMNMYNDFRRGQQNQQNDNESFVNEDS